MPNSYAQDDDSRVMMEPLSPNGNGNGMPRRRGDDHRTNSNKNYSNQFPENYTYVSNGNNSSFTSPPVQEPNNNKQQLKSFTYGGLGPANSNYEDQNNIGDESKLKAQKMHLRWMRNCSTCLRKNGCSNHAMLSQEGPDGDYYRDDFNDQPTGCTIGTTDEDGIWMNRNDAPGSIMAMMVWFLFLYSAVTITFLAETGGINGSYAMVYVTLTCLALACHAKTQFSDPGTVPVSAQPMELLRKQNPNAPLTMCSQCQTFKPPFSHHCRICNRCISRMDHHCPWMNNCVGAGNLKHFTLFLIYTWLCNALALSLLGWNYFFCVADSCMYTLLLTQLARITTVISTGSLLFTSSMIMNVTYGIMTGIGTIDRLKKKAMDTMQLSEEEPIPLKDVFGIAGYHTWLLPIDPVFEDFDRVLGFSTPQRLLREQIKEQGPNDQYYTGGSGSVVTLSTIDHGRENTQDLFEP
jgi:hypothetical protein